MHYLLFYDYVSDYMTRRQAFRAAHFEYARPFVERGELVLGGALADPADAGMLLFRGETPDVARAFCDGRSVRTARPRHRLAGASLDHRGGSHCRGTAAVRQG